MSLDSVLRYHPIAECAPADYSSFDETNRRWSVDQLTFTDRLKRKQGHERSYSALPFHAEKMGHEPHAHSTHLKAIHTLASVLRDHPIAEFAPAEYLSYDKANQSWSVEQLTCTDRVKRKLGLKKYRSTALSFIAEKIGKEPNVSLADLNTVHRLWQRNYPAKRNPLKNGSYTLLDPQNPNLPGNIKSEWMKVGNTSLCLREEEEPDPFDLKASLPFYELDEGTCKNLINITLDGLFALKGKKIVLVLPGTIRLKIFAVTVRTAIRTIEKYLSIHPDRFDEIVISFSQNDVSFLAKAIEVCREMEHPYARFFEPEPQPEMRSSSPASLVRSWTISGQLEEWAQIAQEECTQTAQAQTRHHRSWTDYGSLSGWQPSGRSDLLEEQ